MRRIVRRTIKLVVLAGALSLVALFILFLRSPLAVPLPEKTDLADRLRCFPTRNLALQHPATIHWDDHAIPFIVAESDDDLAFLMGMVHAHLRLGQMAMTLRAAQGRLSEMFGPMTAGIDHSLRILDLGGACGEIEKALPEQTRRWLSRFASGINAYQDGVDEMPFEFKALGMEKSPWTVKDVITLGRLISVDVNWFPWFSLVKLKGHRNWDDLLAGYHRIGSASIPSFTQAANESILYPLLKGLGRTGSNCFVIAPGRTRSGSAIIASDPHLGISIPNTWIIMGGRSPSFHSVGLAFPGLPFVVLGRNRHIAWGGTNMRALSSDLYDASGDALKTRRERIRVRWWRDRMVSIRSSGFGPVLTDAPLFESYHGPPLALRWVGHQATDELTAFYKLNRARDLGQFREAFRSYGVSGQNFLYADTEGTIAQQLAVKLPRRRHDPSRAFILQPQDENREWDGYIGSLELPAAVNPERGFLVSCNNLPVKTDPPVGNLFAPNDRVARIGSHLSKASNISLAEVMALQRDVFSEGSRRLNASFVSMLEECRIPGHGLEQERLLFDALKHWDGSYRADSTGAAAFQLVLHRFAKRYYEGIYDEAITSFLLSSSYLYDLLSMEFQSAEPGRFEGVLTQAFQDCAKRYKAGTTWGDFHRMVLAHPLGRAPLLGRRFVFAGFPASGSSSTVMKTAHAVTDGAHRVRYGSNARHVSVLAEMDENYFCLLGGQDGWLNSAQAVDQIPMWRQGRYIRVPLQAASVRDTFKHRMELIPSGR